MATCVSPVLTLLPALMTFLGPVYVGSFSCESGSSSPMDMADNVRESFSGVSGFSSAGSSVCVD